MIRSALSPTLVSTCCLLACGGGGDGSEADGSGGTLGVGGTYETDRPYSPPPDRVDPTALPGFTNAQVVALGRARTGTSGAGTRQAPQTTRYVSAGNGDDGADGSEGSPWRTLQHAADSVDPGTTVLVDSSGDYTGGLEIRRGGDANAYVVFRGADPGTLPRIVGNPDSDAVVTIDASFVVFQGFEITDHQRASLNEDTYGIVVEPTEASIGHIEIRNNVVHAIGPGVVEQSSCGYDGHGIIAQAEGFAISDLILDGNELYELYVGSSECLVVNGNVDGFRVTNNFVHDVNNIAIDVIGYEKNRAETTTDGYVADNVVLDASNYWPYCTRGNCTYPRGDESSDGIYVDGGADMIIEYNVVGRADHGIELQSENGELIRNVEVRFNAVFNSNYRHLTLGENDGSSEHDNVLFDEPALANAMLESCR